MPIPMTEAMVRENGLRRIRKAYRYPLIDGMTVISMDTRSIHLLLGLIDDQEAELVRLRAIADAVTRLRAARNNTEDALEEMIQSPGDPDIRMECGYAEEEEEEAFIALWQACDRWQDQGDGDED